MNWAIALITALLPFARFAMPSHSARLVFYIGMAVLFVCTTIYIKSTTSQKLKLNLPTIIFLGVAALSICLSQYQERFMAWERFGVFILLLCVTGPLVTNQTWRNVRIKAFDIIGCICVLCSIYYNLLYVFMVTHYCAWMSRYAWVYSYSISISMLFCALCAVGGLYTGWNILNIANEPDSKTNKIFTSQRVKAAILVCSFLSSVNAMLLASSRAAIVAFSFSFLFMCVLKWWKDRHIPTARCICAILISLFCGLNVIIPMTPIMQGKFRNIARHDGDYMASRRSLWSDREEEINSFHLFGTGFASVDPKSVNSYDAKLQPVRGDYSVELNNGSIEPGSSWLYVLSSMGIPGMIVFVILVMCAFLSSLFNAPLYTSLLSFFFIHMFAEGYILSSGALMAYIFWLIMGITFPAGGFFTRMSHYLKTNPRGR